MNAARQIDEACQRFSADISAIGAQMAREVVERTARAAPVPAKAPKIAINAKDLSAAYRKGFADAAKAFTEGVSFETKVFRFNGEATPAWTPE